MNMKILMIKLPEDLHKKFKMHCCDIDITMQEQIVKMIEEELKDKMKK